MLLMLLDVFCTQEQQAKDVYLYESKTQEEEKGKQNKTIFKHMRVRMSEMR